jgi:hypothetical protein
MIDTLLARGIGGSYSVCGLLLRRWLGLASPKEATAIADQQHDDHRSNNVPKTLVLWHRQASLVILLQSLSLLVVAWMTRPGADDHQRWLDFDADPAKVLKPCPTDWLEASRSTSVSATSGTTIGLIEPLLA